MLSLRPIVVNDDMVVLGGNMRLKACKEAGLKEVPIIKARELTDEQQKEFIIKDNVGFGDWDWDALANEWDAEQLDEWGLDVPNFETGELDDLSEQIQPSFRIEVLCKDEEHQEKTYNKLISDGLECKLLTL
jgi:ParB-like chromosome segregation protein Spo0J